jgi:hypothetical protein
VVPGFATSADFAITKPPGQACPNLAIDHRCTIHAELVPRGFRGCTVFDCFGAGQRVTAIFDDPLRQGAAFTTALHLHELQWHLATAAALPVEADLAGRLRQIQETAEEMAGEPERWGRDDVGAMWDASSPLLREASEVARRQSPGPRTDLQGADLVGKDLRGTDLRGANLRGAVLIAADLRGVSLELADLGGADLRNADVRGADLSRALFVTGPQRRAARSDADTAWPGSGGDAAQEGSVTRG